MGVGVADGVSQGGADGQQFRNSQLWSVGQRVFFLHDGRTSNLAQAIREHKSHGSEANRVIDNFENLSRREKKNLIFVSSLTLIWRLGEMIELAVGFLAFAHCHT
jgi:CxxC motif-containing protein (DUF1111 family)